MLLSHLLYTVIDPDWKVLLVTNQEQIFSRANNVLSEKHFNERKRSSTWLTFVPDYFSEKTWTTVSDLCDSSNKWPYKDKEFDFVICDHTLEVVRDPLFMCREIQRIGKRGYIESASPVVNFVKDVERKNVVGFPHHRWFISAENNVLTFAFKNHLLQQKQEYHISFPKENQFQLNPLETITSVFWDKSFAIEEDKEIAEFPDWYFEEMLGYYKDKDKQRFFDPTTPIPVILNNPPFKRNKLVLVKELDVKFGISMFNELGGPSDNMNKYENLLKQQLLL